MPPPPKFAALMVSCATAACSPGLDWREFEPAGSGVTVAFPCRPDRHARTVPLAGAPVRMEMLVCSAAGATFALTYADVAEPATVGLALAELRSLAAGNIGAAAPAVAAAQVPGMTPNPQAGRIALTGRRPDGTPIEQQALLFCKGMRVYQASVIGSPIAPEAASTFLGAPKFVP